MNPLTELLRVKRLLEARYPDIQQIGSDLAIFLRVARGEHSAAISVAEQGWLVECWRADHEHAGEEILFREGIVNDAIEAVERFCHWLENEKPGNGSGQLV